MYIYVYVNVYSFMYRANKLHLALFGFVGVRLGLVLGSINRAQGLPPPKAAKHRLVKCLEVSAEASCGMLRQT